MNTTLNRRDFLKLSGGALAAVAFPSTAAAKKREIIERACVRFDLDPAPFRALLDLRDQRVKPKDVEPGAVLASYLTEIGKVIDAVDSLEKTGF